MIIIIGTICALVALGAGILAAIGDVRFMTIPNYCSIIILGAWVITALAGNTMGVPMTSHTAVGAALFVLSFIMYTFKLWGGGDAKLMAAYGFWFMPHQAISFIFIMAICGGILAIISLVVKNKVKNIKNLDKLNKNHWFRQLEQGKSVIPYGVAIVLSAMIIIIPQLIKQYAQ